MHMADVMLLVFVGLFVLIYGGLGFGAFVVWLEKRKAYKSHTFTHAGTGPKGILSLEVCSRCGQSALTHGGIFADFSDIGVCSGVPQTYFDDTGQEVTLH